MANHTSLSIYKAAYALLNLATDVIKHMSRDLKTPIGSKLRDECLEIMVLIFRANKAWDKVPHIDDLLEHVLVAELLFRLSKDRRLVSPDQYAQAIELTDLIGKQANGWKKYAASLPAA